MLDALLRLPTSDSVTIDEDLVRELESINYLSLAYIDAFLADSLTISITPPVISRTIVTIYADLRDQFV